MKRRLNMAAGIEKLHGVVTAIIYTTHYMEEAERLCDRIVIVDHRRIIALGTTQQLVENAFASRSQILAQFTSPGGVVRAWVEHRGGRLVDSTAQFLQST